MELDMTDAALDEAFSLITQRLYPGATMVGSRVLKGGVSATVHAVEVTGADGPECFVVRQHGAAHWKQLAADVTANEFHLLVALTHAGMPVPRPRLLDDSGRVLASPFFVMDWVKGTTEISDASLDSALRQMAAFLTRLHALDVATLPLPDLPIRESPVSGALEYLPQTEAFRDAREHISRYRLLETRPSLVHGDFWPGNILWANEQLAAVLDWEDAALGPAESDVACCRAELNVAFGEIAAQTFTTYYLAAFPERLRDLALWDVYVSAAALASLHNWNLPPEVEARRRERTTTFLTRAVQALLHSG